MYILYCLIGIFVIVFTVVMAICLHKKRQNKRHEFKSQIAERQAVQQKIVQTPTQTSQIMRVPQIIYDHEQFAIENGVLIKYLGKDLNVVIPKGVKVIGMDAFALNERIRQVSIPLGVEKILGSAFLGCTMLTSFDFPESISYIGISAFSGCVSLKEIKLPLNVSIEQEAFRGCKSLTKIYSPSLSSWLNHKQNAFDKYVKYDLYIDNSLTENLTLQENTIPQQCFANCKSLKKVIFAKGVKIIGREAFQESSCQEIDIGDTVEEIHQDAFAYCEQLTKLYIPKNVVLIETRAFDRCYHLKEVSLPSAYQARTKYIFGDWKDIQYIFYD